MRDKSKKTPDRKFPQVMNDKSLKSNSNSGDSEHRISQIFLKQSQKSIGGGSEAKRNALLLLVWPMGMVIFSTWGTFGRR
jgi:hypothetical protein